MSRIMIAQFFLAVGAVACTAAVAKYIWQARDSFYNVYKQIKEEYGKK